MKQLYLVQNNHEMQGNNIVLQDKTFNIIMIFEYMLLKKNAKHLYILLILYCNF